MRTSLKYLTGLTALTLGSGCFDTKYFTGEFRGYDVIISRNTNERFRTIRMSGVGVGNLGDSLPIHEIFAIDSDGDGVFEDIKVTMDAGYAMPALAHRDSLKTVYDSILVQEKRK